MTQGRAPDEKVVRKQFSQKKIVDLTAAAVAINT